MTEQVYLAAVRMYNCQSHVDTVYRFSPDKVNVIFGDNSVGKSVFFKMLKASLNPKSFQEKDRIDLIRKKTEYAQIQYLFSDNSSAVCRVYQKGFIYQYQNSPEEKPIITNEPHEKFLEKLNILMDDNSGFITNLIDGDNDRLLVNSNLKSNYHFLKIIVDSEDIETLLEKIPMKIADAQKMYSNLHNKLNYVNQRLNVIDYVNEDALRSEIDMMEACNSVLYEGIDIYKYLQTLGTIFTEKKDFSGLLYKTDTLLKIVNVCQILDKLEPVEHFNNDVLNLCEKAVKVTKVAETLQSLKIPNETQVQLNEAALGILPVLIKITELQVIDLNKDYDSMIRLIQKIEYMLGSMCAVDVIKPSEYDTEIRLIDLTEKLIKVEGLLNELDNSIKQSVIAKNEHQQILTQIKESNAMVHCPVYGEVIFDEQRCMPLS